jgi:hypothetical protein
MSIGHRHTPRCSINSYRDPTAGRPSGRSNMFTVPRLMVRMVEARTYGCRLKMNPHTKIAFELIQQKREFSGVAKIPAIVSE